MGNMRGVIDSLVISYTNSILSINNIYSFHRSRNRGFKIITIYIYIYIYKYI